MQVIYLKKKKKTPYIQNVKEHLNFNIRKTNYLVRRREKDLNKNFIDNDIDVKGIHMKSLVSLVNRGN